MRRPFYADMAWEDVDVVLRSGTIDTEKMARTFARVWWFVAQTDESWRWIWFLLTEAGRRRWRRERDGTF